MMSKTMISTASAVALAVGLALPTISLAQANPADAPVYGSQLMTEQERLEYREQMREAQTLEEREQLRSEHVERIQQRARDQGVTLSDDRPGAGSGMGPRDDAERGGRNMSDDRMRPRDGQGEGMEERYREERQEQRREHMMDNEEYRRGSGSGMGGGGGRN